MHTLQTKVPDRIGVIFEEVCKEKGKTPYQCLKELVYRFLIDQGYQVYEDAPVETRIEVLKQRVDKLEKEVNELKKQLGQITSVIEKMNKSGLYGFMNKRR